MELGPYLNSSGQCATAFERYAEVLSGRIEMLQTHGESPMKAHLPAEWHDKVLHARLALADQVLMGSDAPPSHYVPSQGIHVSISVPR